MLITLEEVEGRLKSSDNLINKLRVEDKPRHPGNSVGRQSYGQELQVKAAAEAHFKSAKVVSAETGISVRQVECLKSGSTDGRSQNQALIDLTRQRLDAARDTALDKLMLTLGLISLDKLEKSDGKDLSTIAANMSKIALNATPEMRQGSNVNILVYAPRQKDIEDFEIIEG